PIPPVQHAFPTRRSSDLNAKCAAIHTRIRIAHTSAVKDIEHVRAELNSDSFCYPRVLHNPKILASVAWSPSVRQETGRIAKTKSEGVDGRTRWRRKRSGVQVLRPVDDVQTVRGQGLRDSGDNICAQPARCRAT